jgi:hypothetical protein
MLDDEARKACPKSVRQALPFSLMRILSCYWPIWREKIEGGREVGERTYTFQIAMDNTARMHIL